MGKSAAGCSQQTSPLGFEPHTCSMGWLPGPAQSSGPPLASAHVRLWLLVALILPSTFRDLKTPGLNTDFSFWVSQFPISGENRTGSPEPVDSSAGVRCLPASRFAMEGDVNKTTWCVPGHLGPTLHLACGQFQIRGAWLARSSGRRLLLILGSRYYHFHFTYKGRS